MKRKIGIALIVSAIAIWLMDRSSSIVSSFLAKAWCQDSYMQAINGVVGDKSCGFNADMYLAVFLFVVLVIGMILIVTAKK